MGLNTTSRTFLMLSVVQAVIVIALQATILGVGDFSSSSEGGLGKDRQVYAVLYLCAVVYSIYFAYDALSRENIIQVFAFLFLNALYTMYGIVQIFQFRDVNLIVSGVDTGDRPWGTVDSLAVACTCVLGVLTIIFAVISRQLFKEFGWRIYKKIGADPRIRSMYRTYQIYLMILKVDLATVVIFLIQHCAVLLQTDDYEFIMSIIAIPVIIAIIIFAYWGARKEKRAVIVFFIIILLAALAYFAFKFYRFNTKSCPICEVEIASGAVQSFVFLEIFSAINFLLMLATLVISCLVMAHFDKGLLEHLNSTTSGARDSYVADNGGRSMNLQL
ncbi:hypothetical protein CAOG_00542 [Capsaspora owczarzaki ATCC 30864]|uniref:Uncharacterized protein n=1 Tax=Capsaspora owczarzaki (strain ATCC 30864) TaxID=595528 RepID=A0A0D2WIP9_CAPO3|nr:hypothetical protein CAOG_00542 [Capsaspora owczarzaki ATCC 30864]KJE88978.1 hypothetical protein CAOG_000542 [Capsaspora owczarzaki ATCC 30864]|eukprot:XP_004365413.1 hypothetical protein CAOG_00542 [Capsaspora owczarzaki ATCC 30864]